jgi:hypothetical protein
MLRARHNPGPAARHPRLSPPRGYLHFQSAIWKRVRFWEDAIIPGARSAIPGARSARSYIYALAARRRAEERPDGRYVLRQSTWHAAISSSTSVNLSAAATSRLSKRWRADTAGAFAPRKSRSFGVAASTSQIRTSVARFGSRSPVA